MPSKIRIAVGAIVAALVVAAIGAALWRAGKRGPRAAQTYHRAVVIEASAAAAPGAGVEVDLYVPPGGEPAPLLVLLVGGRRDASGEAMRVGAGVGDAMQREGIAVAVVRFTLSDGYLFARCADDVARAFRKIVDMAPERGVDGSHPVLAGTDIGATLAASLALDGRSLSRAGFDVQRLRAVVVTRGTYDLSDAGLERHPDRDLFTWALGGDAASRAAASPNAIAGPGAPPFLILSGGADAPEWSQVARAFAEALERAGARSVERFIVPGRDGRSAMDLEGDDNPLRDLLATYVRRGPGPLPVEGAWGVRQRWGRVSPISSEPFWQDPRLVVSRPVDDRFRAAVERVLGGDMYELFPWPAREYQAIDLAAWLDAQPPDAIGRGDWLIVSNVRDERIVLRRSDVARWRPVVVVGLDGERNLYRLVAWYQLTRASSWHPDEPRPPVMARPVGAFLHFPDEPPPELVTLTYAPYGLTPKSFRLVADDPLGPMRGLAKPLVDTLIGEQGCLACHALGGVGGRSHHVRADDGKAEGAYGLALEEYPPEVLRKFLFEQDTVAAGFGVLPLRVAPETARDLEALVAQKRASR